MIKIRARAPLRISLAGGGTDIENYYKIFGGSAVNIALKKYAFSEISLEGETFTANATDINKNVSFELNKEDFKSDLLPLHWQTYLYIMNKFNNEKLIPAKISTYCDAPIGSGLGSSSTLVVSMIKAWDSLLDLGMDQYDLAEHAFHIERKICNLAGGRQDHYAASFGGINLIEFTKEKVQVHPLKIKNWIKCDLESSILLHNTGVSRQSSVIISDQINILNNQTKLMNLHMIKSFTNDTKKALLRGNIDELVEIINKSWVYKKNTSKKINSEKIQERISIGIASGAKAAKVSGAGGGGFIIFIGEPSKLMKVKSELAKFNTDTYFANFTDQSAEAWEVKK